MKTLFIILLFIPLLSRPQFVDNSIDNITLNDIATYFSGQWKSQPEACVGIGKADRSYEFIFDSTYLFLNNVAYFESTEEKNSGNDHADWSFFSHDKIHNKLMLREFNSEGYVNEYFLDTIKTEGNSQLLIFLSESLENAPDNWTARVTLTIHNENSFEELFELAGSDKEYKTYVHSFWEKK